MRGSTITEAIAFRGYDSGMNEAQQRVDEARGFKILEDAFRWAIAHNFAPGNVVIQDEYTHDVIFLARDGSALVFDAT